MVLESGDTAAQVDEMSAEKSGELRSPETRARLKNFLPRVLSSLILAPLALFATYYGGWLFAALVAVAGAVALTEWLRFTDRSDKVVTVLAVAFLGFAASVAHIVGPDLAFLSAGVSACVVWAVSQLRGGSGRWAAGGFVYIVLPVISLIWLRHSEGFDLIFWILGIVWAMDIGAYVFGSLLGGAKLAPRLSPNKTWSGVIGGTLCAALVSFLLGTWFNLGLPAFLILVGGGLALWSQVGDVLESSIKRRFGVKDSGSIIPGHGGVLDRIDSLVFTAPVVALGSWLF